MATCLYCGAEDDPICPYCGETICSDERVAPDEMAHMDCWEES